MTLPPDIDRRAMPTEVPNPSHRHGTPSGPWPFLDLHVTIDPNSIIDPQVASKTCEHRKHDEKHCWCKYPQSLYPNWTPVQQRASRISEVLGSRHGWRVYPLVVSKSGIFKPLPYKSGRFNQMDDFWSEFRLPEEKAKNCHVYALFIDSMTGPIMQMLGTKYNIEPFFFSSSFGWIPSRYQESQIPKQSDHITITLTFIHCINDPKPGAENDNASIDSDYGEDYDEQRNIAIKTNEFLWLSSSRRILFSDIISLHLIRHPTEGHTIISYHAPRKFRATQAKTLCDRFQLTGCSVYWSKIFERSKDPTFAFLSLLWYALYAWDESLEALYNHICFLESNVLENTELDYTQELHRIRAHLLHYTSLLDDFRKSVEFVKDTYYPALDNEAFFMPEEKQESRDLMALECKNLMNQINRLDMARKMQDKRLTNVMQLGFSTVNIMDSKRMRRLTEAAVRDSAAMKQIAYLTMFFLPASFAATAFGMNVGEINGANPTLGQYFATALPLTAITVWIVVALQIDIKEPSRSRRRSRPSKHSQPQALPNGVNAPPGHYIRRAYTSPEGDIVIESPVPESNTEYDSENEYHKDDDIPDYGHNYQYDGYDSVPRASLWKRLLWPISLTRTSLINWHESRRKKTKQRRQNAQLSGVHHRNHANGHTLPTHFFHNHGNRNARTPAAQYAADVRSSHSGSSRSMEQVPRTSELPPSLPGPSILRHENELEPVAEEPTNSEPPAAVPRSGVEFVAPPLAPESGIMWRVGAITPSFMISILPLPSL
ncbi:hypothetical protein AN958_11690 [Leucoagaricus sp. SymC.cos]|nr:hypothetical protein AN958_11690 [Leucoagaricus sp. SymC.cos]